ncbi:MAG: Methyltransferase type 11 [Microgenomates group bacterium GW2011_GWC1_41_8]|nr:MAG: Methyltransferase type 11 [Microgenomates group bacterium GW2011_GWC1_41_8]
MRDVTKETSRFWNSDAVVKEFEIQPLSLYWIDFFSSIKNASNMTVLDLGCGGGRNTTMLINHGFNVFSCDVNEKMIESTRRKVMDFGLSKSESIKRVSAQTMTHLSFPECFFDIVLSHGVYHNALSLEKFKTAIKESSRVLKNGGLLCFNIFTSGYIGSDLVEFKNSPNLYLTKDGMPLVLLSKNEFIAESKLNNLFPISDFVEYTSNISTGKRSVARGVLRKICN